jgi:uncharacterized protein YciI
MLFAVILNSSNVLPDVSRELREERSAFLTALLASGKLLFEGNLGDTASLMFMEAESVNETLSLLQDDPFAVQPISSSIQIRPLAVNVVAHEKRLSPTNGKSKLSEAKNTETE